MVLFRRFAALLTAGTLGLTAAPAAATATGPTPAATVEADRLARLAAIDHGDPVRFTPSATPQANGFRKASATPVPSSAMERYLTIDTKYVDACGDSYGANDLRRVFVGEDTDYEAMYFASSMCQRVNTSELVAGSVQFAMFTGNGDESYGVVLDVDGSGRPRVFVIHAPTSDPATWSKTYEGPGLILDDGYEIGAAVPYWALDDHFEFGFFVTTWNSGDTPTDELPERDAGILFYPWTCDAIVRWRAGVTAMPGHERAVKSALVAAGYDVVGDGPTLSVRDVQDLSALREIPGVDHVERPPALTRYATPTDPSWTRQWHLETVGAPAAWQKVSKSNVTIAVIDDGVDARRTDLAGRVVGGWDSNLGKAILSGRNSDLGGHGTAIAGLIAAAGDNGRELTGVDWGARIAPYRIWDASGCTDAAVAADAVRRAADSGVRILNLSFGSTEPSQVLADAVAYAVNKGLLLVAAAGNDASVNQPNYPAAYPGVIAVGATTRSDTVTRYSNRGSYVDLVAPGGDGSGSESGDMSVLADRGIAYERGTSFAAPLVVGAASLYLQLHPTLTGTQVAEALLKSAKDLGTAGRDDTYGHGRLDIAKLVNTAPPAPTAPVRTTTGFDGNPATSERLDTTDAFRGAASVSSQRFAADQARHVVLARHDKFADALSGSALLGDGPLLFSFTDRIPDFVVAEMQRVVPSGGRVYLLGGPAALNDNVVAQVKAAGLSPKRLHGPTRFETSVAIANEVMARYPGAERLLIARGDGEGTRAWADAITGGGFAARERIPVLLSPQAALDPATARWLDSHPSLGRLLLGGTAALSIDVERRAGGTRHRVAGADRFETAVQIANQLWQTPRSGERRRVIVNTYRTDGWWFGLIGAGLSADNEAPILAVGDSTPVSKSTADMVATCGSTAQVDLFLLGSRAVILDHVAGELDRQDPRPC